jgi:hypothetical protein
VYACKYHCNYGPEDHHGDPRHPKLKNRGCTSKFFVKCLYKYPNVAKISWYHQGHTREDGTLSEHLIMTLNDVNLDMQVAFL